jgi:predicted DNA-binding transcriptional regulator AlpA
VHPNPEPFEIRRKAPQEDIDDDILLTSRQTRARFGGITSMSLWRWRHNPKVMFPPPVMITNRNYWRVGDLRRWQAEREAKAAL